MSNALAIASVTAVLSDLLNNGLIDHDLSSALGNVIVSAVAPDLIVTDVNQPPRLNLFMYHTTTNQGWRNIGLPGRDSNGDRSRNPPLALDLHYLLTAYGSKDFQAEILLGYAMQLLHETPVLPRDAIRKTLQPTSPVTGSILPPALQTLVASDLADQVELIKLTPEFPSTEELSRLWTALQAHYRPTAGYMASVVLIQSTQSTKSGLPVRVPKLTVLPYRHPEVLSVDPQIVMSGATLTISGVNLKSVGVGVDFGSGPVTPATVTDSSITITVPAAQQAGVANLQVVQPLDLGTPADPHGGFSSNVFPFVLRPAVTSSSATGSIVTIHVNPAVVPGQKFILLLNSAAGASYSFDAGSITTTTNDVDVPITGVTSDTYSVRVQVDGAQSVLDVDPTTGRYVGTPAVVIP